MHHPEPVPTQGRGRGSYKRLAMSGSMLAVPPAIDAAHVAPKQDPNLRPRHKLRPVEPEQEVASFEKPLFQWVKGELLGKGSYGRVYFALNATTGQLMAVKQVEKPMTPSDQLKTELKQIVNALRDENRVLRNLDHPNIVQYLGFEENFETLNIFLEYIPGGTIHSCLRTYGVFKDDVTRDFVRQILLGLQYLHEKNIIHRDLKSENILVQPTGVCKISDFGISKDFADLDSKQNFTAMRGTYQWMAPEVIDSGGRGYGLKVDIWSLGCLVLEMWTSKRPWDGDDWINVMFKLIQHKQPPPVPPDLILDEVAEGFRKSCFRSDPRERPSAKRLLTHAYLELSPDYVFPGAEWMGKNSKPKVETLVLDSRSRSRSRTRSPSPSPPTIIAPKPKPVPRAPPLLNPQDKPKPAAIIETDREPPSVVAGPPLVYITPPGSPKQDESWPYDLSASYSSDQTTVRQKSSTRRLIVHNPDENDTDIRQTSRSTNRKPRHVSHQPTFVYNPPPLPNPVMAQYSSRLAPASRNVSPATSLSNSRSTSPAAPPSDPPIIKSQPVGAPVLRKPIPQASQPTSGLAHQRQGSNDLRTSDDGYDTDAENESIVTSSTWQRPPLDFRNPRNMISRGALKLESKSSSRPSTPPISIPGTNLIPPTPLSISHKPTFRKVRNSDESSRPVVEEVYQHLTDFFPHHDLDNPIIPSPIEINHDVAALPDASGPQRITMKSIRRLAEEQILQHDAPSLKRRWRQTPLWDMRTEEIKSPI